MTTQQSLYFTFDGLDSRQFNVTRVHSKGGLFQESFGANRSIIEESVRGRAKPYYFGTETSPIEGSFEIMIGDNADELTDENIYKLQEWLFHDTYKELSFSDQPEKIYYAMFINDPMIFHNGAKAGYIELAYRCNSAYAYSPVITKSVYIDSNTTAEEVIVENYGHFKIKPIIKLKKVTNGSLSIINASNGGIETKLNNLIDNEEVEIDMENESIETDVPTVYHYGNFNNNFLELVRGVNRLQIKGKGHLQIEYQYIFQS